MKYDPFMKIYFIIGYILFGMAANAQQSEWVQYKGTSGPGQDKHIVFISGDEEYRSEEALPMLAKILSKKYGFTCTVLFSIDPKTGMIDPKNQTNIPGLNNLEKADLMFMSLRFRELPDDQMKNIVNNLESGKPVIGIRTSTHAFNYTRNKKSIYARYDFKSTVSEWEDGFGRQILGETWVDHHGKHGKEGTRGLINGIEQNAKNPLLNGVGDIWCATDVYTVRELPSNARILIFGQPTKGMTPDAPVNTEKSLMPVAWTRNYLTPSGKKGREFATTMGASVDLVNEDLRRLLVNAVFWSLDMENKIPEKADVSFVEEYKPTMFGFDSYVMKIYPSHFEMK